MGLDSIWVNQDNSKGVIPGKFNVCGGMFSDNGNQSFRGKVYNQIIESVTGVSLYQEEIPNETIKQMTDALKSIKWNSQFGFDHDIDSDEFSDLVRMFEAHASAGHKLVGWW